MPLFLCCASLFPHHKRDICLSLPFSLGSPKELSGVLSKHNDQNQPLLPHMSLPNASDGI